MNIRTVTTAAILGLVSFAFLPTANAGDKDKSKMAQWQYQQLQLQQQWKLQEVQRQQQLLQQQQQARRRAVVSASRPWGVNENGRGSIVFNGGTRDRLNSVVVTLTNFYNGNGNVNNGGQATVTLYGDYSYPLHGTWSLQGDLTVGLNLVPAAHTLRGDRAVGSLQMSRPNGSSLSNLALSGIMSGNSFNANFSSRY